MSSNFGGKHKAIFDKNRRMTRFVLVLTQYSMFVNISGFEMDGSVCKKFKKRLSTLCEYNCNKYTNNYESLNLMEMFE